VAAHRIISDSVRAKSNFDQSTQRLVRATIDTESFVASVRREKQVLFGINQDAGDTGVVGQRAEIRA